MGYMKIDAIPEARYLCDTIEDLSTLLPRPNYGDTCWVISEAREYIRNSKGEWLPKDKISAGVDTKVDLTGYATEDFVQEQIQNIEHPIVEVPSKLSELENDVNHVSQDYVDTKVADLVNSAPETLDTIGEIAQALKEHQDVADAITEAIGKKADKEDLPSIEGLASEAFVTEAIQKIEFPVTDLSNYYTRDEVTQAIIDNVVQADWDENNSESNAYVMNRPFYDSRTNIIEWDGETSDTIVTIPEMNVTLYRVSDTPLTKAELGTVTYYNFGNTKGYTNLNSDLWISDDGKIITESQTFAFISILEDGAVLSQGNGIKDVTFEKKGIYFWKLQITATAGMKTQKIKYGAVTQIPDYYISNKIARQIDVDWMDYSTPKTLNIYAADLDKDVITEVYSSGYIAGSGYNYTNNLGDAFDYTTLKQYLKYATNKTNVGISWCSSENMIEKRQALDLHMGEDGIGFHFIKDITFDETTGQPQFNLKKIWVANPNYVAG